ncbi:MAG: flagellar basal body-associated FliL family protein [Bacillota bacterium]|nr:flagellar basal body-associated FliL family protein [Bacillota bacterium]
MDKKGLLILLIIMMALIIFFIGTIAVVVTDIFDGKNTSVAEGEEIQTYKYQMDKAIVTNIKNSNSYVKCRLTFKLNNEQDQLEFEDKAYIVNDIILEVLRSYTATQYRATDIKDKIANSIEEEIVKNLDLTSDIKSIYFEELITQ